MTAAGTLAMTGVAFADTLQDTITDTTSGISLVAGSATGATAGIKLVGNNAQGDPDPGCNIDAGEAPLKLDVITPAGVTATPDPMSITSCGTDFAVSFTASATAVGGNATVVVVSGPAGGGTYVNQVDIPITITQPAPTNTAPQVSVTGVEDGATYEKSNVPQPGCSVTDEEDSDESATVQVTNGAFDGLGAHTATCSYTDGGQVTRSASSTYTVVRDKDLSAPVVVYTLDPATPTGDDGWYTGPVSLKWSVTEAESPETLTTKGCEDRSITTDQAATSYTCSASSEGGDASESVTIKRDATAPEVSYDGVVSGTEGANGWYTSAVSVRFAATDSLSGPASATQQVTSSGDGSAVTLGSPAFSDTAGNTTAAGDATSPAFKIDTQRPNAPTASLSPLPNGAGWNNGDVVVHFAPAGDNGPSGVASCTADRMVTTEGADQTVSGTCTDEAGNESVVTEVAVDLDRTAPTVDSTVTVAGTAGKNGWYTSDVEVTFKASDALSGLHADTAKVTSSGEGATVEVTSPVFADRAGNTTAAGAVSKTYKVDKTAPTAPTFNGGPGATYYFGNDPVAPTCSSSDTTSGLASCVVTGGGSTVGQHTYTATATDNAGHTSTSTHTYTVLKWDAMGYFAPVDMGGVWNTVKGGSTVPLKFEAFAGATELMNTTAVTSFVARTVTCPGASAPTDEIETVLTGGTNLRYDATAGQFVQNWQTPKKPGTCAQAVTTLRDGSSITASFMFK
jgi:hypothetical protein